MVHKSIVLTEQENTVLTAIAEQESKTEEEILHEVVQQYLANYQQTDRLALLRQARGMWKDRDDLPTVRELRDEAERFGRYWDRDA